MAAPFPGTEKKKPALRLVFSLCFGRSDEKKFCLLQVLRYRGFVKQKSMNCYKSIKSIKSLCLRSYLHQIPPNTVAPMPPSLSPTCTPPHTEGTLGKI
jgi:hypothetical protein